MVAAGRVRGKGWRAAYGLAYRVRPGERRSPARGTAERGGVLSMMVRGLAILVADLARGPGRLRSAVSRRRLLYNTAMVATLDTIGRAMQSGPVRAPEGDT
jgi:hypothetical protein